MPRGSLDKYRSMRDFNKTPEPPPGDPDAQSRNLVFVVQQHRASRAGMHWDFRLEVNGVLASWPLRKAPSLDTAVKRGAVQTEDHPYDYRTFEGVIPRGEYGGGEVIVWDEGIYTPDEDGVTSWDDKDTGSERMAAMVKAGKASFTLQGHKLRGSFALVKTKYKDNSWLLIKHRDEHVSSRDLEADDRSVRSGLTIKDLQEGRLPNPGASSLEGQAGARKAAFPGSTKLKPMFATLVDKAFDSPGWLWEPKLDGIRALIFVNEGKVEIRSRRGVDVTKAYPALVRSLESQPVKNMVLDGEICALDPEGVPRFQLLQPRINLTRSVDIARAESEQPVVFFAFDLLYLEGYDLTGVALRDRKALVQTRLLPRDDIRTVSYVEEDGTSLAEAALGLGFEGVMGKRSESKYEPGARSRSWLKAKTVMEQEFVVGGYTAGEGRRSSAFGALALGYYDDDGVLHYTANAGSGFNDKQLDEFTAKLKALETDKSPFKAGPPVEGKPKWVRPELIVQVKFAEWTKDGRLRAPVFMGLRDDIEPKNVRREQARKLADIALEEVEAASGGSSSRISVRDKAVAAQTVGSGIRAEVESVLRQLENPRKDFVIEVGGQDIKLTNLDKEFWPAYGNHPPRPKRELIRYYARVAPYLLPHLKDRPLTLTRYPNGITARPFYQKHYEQPIPSYVDTTLIWSDSNKGDGEYIICNNLPTLIWLAQLADLEMHAWMSRVESEPDAAERPRTFSGGEENIDASVLSYPDFMVFDLDPYIYSGQEKAGDEPEFNRKGWEKTVEIALTLKEMMDELSLSSFVKTTGKTGIHVYVPILRHWDYETVRVATATIGRFLIQMKPKDVTMEWDTSKRKGKVFFDHNQNTRGKTLAAQYSLRPTPWGGASMPVAWSELPKLDPTNLNIDTLPQRLQEHGDPWVDILSHKNDLGPLISA